MYGELTVLLVLSHAIAADEPRHRSIPPVIESTTSEVPAWVSVSSAVDASGRMHSGLLTTYDAERLRNAAARNPRRIVSGDTLAADGECTTFIGRGLHQPGEKRTLAELTRSARAVFSGRVEGGEQGFLFGQPGTLFEITVGETAKGDEAPGSIVYLFYPFAKIATEGGLICARPIGQTVLPQTGDTIVLFPFLPPEPLSVRIYMAEPRWQLIVVRDGRTFVPENLTRELREDTGARTILQRVREGAKRPNTPAGARR